jgi:hypothetical protein
MLPRPRLRDDARLAHAPRQQNLADAVVDLVRACVVQLVALEIDFRAAKMLRQALGEIERARPADIMLQQPVKFLLERRVGLRLAVFLLKLEHQRHQRLGHIPSAKFPKPPIGVGPLGPGVGTCSGSVCHGASDRPSTGAFQGGFPPRLPFAPAPGE